MSAAPTLPQPSTPTRTTPVPIGWEGTGTTPSDRWVELVVQRQPAAVAVEVLDEEIGGPGVAALAPAGAVGRDGHGRVAPQGAGDGQRLGGGDVQEGGLRAAPVERRQQRVLVDQRAPG